jgi:hypothetical protein
MLAALAYRSTGPVDAVRACRCVSAATGTHAQLDRRPLADAAARRLLLILILNRPRRPLSRTSSLSLHSATVISRRYQ